MYRYTYLIQKTTPGDGTESGTVAISSSTDSSKENSEDD